MQGVLVGLVLTLLVDWALSRFGGSKAVGIVSAGCQGRWTVKRSSMLCVVGWLRGVLRWPKLHVLCSSVCKAPPDSACRLLLLPLLAGRTICLGPQTPRQQPSPASAASAGTQQASGWQWC